MAVRPLKKRVSGGIRDAIGLRIDQGRIDVGPSSMPLEVEMSWSSLPADVTGC